MYKKYAVKLNIKINTGNLVQFELLTSVKNKFLNQFF